MSALSAIFWVNGETAAEQMLRRMSDAVVHRGADSGLVVEGPIGLAHRAGPGPIGEHQPLVDSKHGLMMVLTGRLYNLPELMDALAGAGHDPGDGSQGAAIFAAYRVWGADCIGQFDGDFAFVLYDARRHRVICARDALGVKPLFYAFDGRCLLVGSEPKQLLAAGIPTVPCDEAIAAFLSLERSLLGGNRSFYRDIFRLEPGHYAVIESKGLRTLNHWRLDPTRRNPEHSDDDAAACVRELMGDAVRRRIPETAPYACALSGGFDSSSVAGLYRRELDRRGIDAPLRSFAFELRDQDADEPEMIDIVAKRVRAQHTSIYLDRDNVFDVLPQIVRAGDQPQYDMGLLYLWRKKEAAAENGVRVILSGLGGDELFFGRYHFFADQLRRFQWLALWREIRGVYPIDLSTGKRTSLNRLIRAYVVSPMVPRAAKHFGKYTLLGKSAVQPWIRRDLAERVGLAERLRTGPPRIYDDAYRQDCFEIFHYVLVQLTLSIHEALGAALGVETRFPLLDRRLVEYMFAAPREQKISNGQTRILQRRAMEGILPPEVTREHLKKNVNTVLWRQQRAHFNRELAQLMARPRLLSEDYVARDQLDALYRQYLSSQGTAQDGFMLWYVFSLEKWLETLT